MRYPWFRLYSEILNDPKIKRAARELQKPLPEVIGYWITLLCLANDSPERGSIMLGDGIAIELEDLEYYFEIAADQVEFILSVFYKLGMLHLSDQGYKINNWEKRQFKSDYSTERVRKHRMERDSNDDETLQKRYNGVTSYPPDAGDNSNQAPTGTETLPKRDSNVIEERRGESEKRKKEKIKTTAPAFKSTGGGVFYILGLWNIDKDEIDNGTVKKLEQIIMANGEYKTCELAQEVHSKDYKFRPGLAKIEKDIFDYVPEGGDPNHGEIDY